MVFAIYGIIYIIEIMSTYSHPGVDRIWTFQENTTYFFLKIFEHSILYPLQLSCPQSSPTKNLGIDGADASAALRQDGVRGLRPMLRNTVDLVIDINHNQCESAINLNLL